ncbi:MAG: biotin carboxylase N-terminal domain-containing protein [Dysgonamonadaceae bacterium]|nr:biotin carboxylase N-terminal domain-containing protein [Dysgonamonadaceae bacterium]MDD3356538.1 biotin carboxylase N-terminal domain-containing protein [Dysgonamonadaceae bacterium]MDD3727523.1 biotin carboxylase N-terminal domain-containing protein [Dysgonamonadaceae bacterium]MDD4246984.1 biotin carboxylase N-terminal domain-containing protein [Dysgonamonadaceae bacterium]
MIDNSIKYRPIHRLLVANRGEIAVRIIRTARKMGIKTIGVITKFEPHTTADEEIFLEGNTLAETYLNVEAIIKAALAKKADAIHPGYGFLSENPLLAEASQKAGLLFVGPTAEVIRKIGDKANARRLAQSLDIPVTKGFFGTVEEIYKQKQELPYPLLIKAAVGGGGKAMIMVISPTELYSKLKQASREAERYFGDKTLLVEQLIHQPRHIEVQILADHHGNCIHLYERECSIQRRYQKIIEESPSPFVTEALREKLTSDALKLCKNIGYQNAGTVEFLVDKNANYFFLEVNARLQVEHPVTEMITSIDLVEQQLLIAMGLPLELSQEEIKIDGHALECRIYAEDPQNNFQPAPGKILSVQWPKESLARTDSWFYEPVEILPDFDPMLAKIITHAPTRSYAIEKMKMALQSTLLMGNINNIWYLKNIMKNSDFKAGRINTDFCEVFKAPIPAPTTIESVVAATLIWQFQTKPLTTDVWGEIGFFRFSNQVRYLINGKPIEINYQREEEHFSFSLKEETPKAVSNVLIEENKIEFSLDNKKLQFNWVITPDNELLLEREVENWKVMPHHQLPKNSANKNPLISNHNGAGVTAPIPGKIIEINIHEGEQIKAGDTLMVLEAMKMENHIQMPQDGIVKKIFIEQGNQVKANEILVEIENIKN